MKSDFGQMNAEEAEEKAKKIGWRLPTAEELNLIYEHSEDKQLGEFSTSYYLALDYVVEEAGTDTLKTVSRKYFVNGEEIILKTGEELRSRYGVRLVRYRSNL